MPINKKLLYPPDKVYVWMYYETDGDAGYYQVRLFQTEALARAYQQARHDAYGGVTKIEVVQSLQSIARDLTNA